MSIASLRIRPVSPAGAVQMSARELRGLSFLLPLSEDYPNLVPWYVTKVVPGLRFGTRTLLLVERNEELVGLGIAKHESDERKICTVRVTQRYFGRGLGLKIFDGLMKWLDDDQPHFTVNAEKLPAFERIFDYYGFKVTSSNRGLYLPNAIELGYNENRYTRSNLDRLSDSHIQ